MNDLTIDTLSDEVIDAIEATIAHLDQRLPGHFNSAGESYLWTADDTLTSI